MEPNKLETQIKDKLNNREIQPSVQTWDRLDAMLTVAEGKKIKRPFGYWFIAASTTIFISLSPFLFKQNTIGNNKNNNIVTTESKKGTIQNPIKNNQKQNSIATSSNIQLENQSSKLTIKKSIINQKTNKNQNNSIQSIAIANNLEVNSSGFKDKPLVSLQQMEKPNYVNVEELLHSAEKIKTPSIKVNASSLLSQVDGEVEHTFREKIFTRINKNYQQVKVAVANRNNQE